LSNAIGDGWVEEVIGRSFQDDRVSASGRKLLALADQREMRAVPVDVPSLLEVKEVHLLNEGGQYKGVSREKVKERGSAGLLRTENDRVGEEAITCCCEPVSDNPRSRQVAAPARNPATDGQTWKPDCPLQGSSHLRIHARALTASTRV
jgi:hypothetical protein